MTLGEALVTDENGYGPAGIRLSPWRPLKPNSIIDPAFPSDNLLLQAALAE